MKDLLFTVLALILSATFAPLPSTAATFQQIDYPHSNSTSANAINDLNEIVGYYQDGNNFYHAFRYSNDDYTNIDPPNSSFAIANGINNTGVIVGGYSTTGLAMGFIDRNGKYSNVVYPDPKQQGTELWGINNQGTMVGNYSVRNSQGSLRTFGFILMAGKFQRLDVPDSTNTLPNAINDSGEVVGTYTKADGTSYGFTYLNGKYTTVNYPGAVGTGSASAINDKGVLIGGYAKDGVDKGFERVSAKYTTIVYPGSSSTNTALKGINKNDYIVGNYGENTPPTTKGFLRLP